MEIGSIQNVAALSSAMTQAAMPENHTEQRELVKAVRSLNAAEVFGESRELAFAVDRETRRTVIRIVDRESREVIQQIPAEYALRMAQDFRSRQAW